MRSCTPVQAVVVLAVERQRDLVDPVEVPRRGSLDGVGLQFERGFHVDNLGVVRAEQPLCVRERAADREPDQHVSVSIAPRLSQGLCLHSVCCWRVHNTTCVVGYNGLYCFAGKGGGRSQPRVILANGVLPWAAKPRRSWCMRPCWSTKSSRWWWC